MSKEAKLPEVLEEHWIYQLNCDHDAKTDDITCACGWTGKGYLSVGEAVSRWAAHVINVLAENDGNDGNDGVVSDYIPSEREKGLEALLREGKAMCILAPVPTVGAIRIYTREETLDWHRRVEQFLGPDPSPAGVFAR